MFKIVSSFIRFESMWSSGRYKKSKIFAKKSFRESNWRIKSKRRGVALASCDCMEF